MKLFDAYPHLPFVPTKAQGNYLWNAKGQQFLDLYGGHAVISIGHSHPHFTQKLEGQLQQLAFYSNAVDLPIRHELASCLGELTGLNDHQLFLCNSGAEANENALHLALRHTGKSKVVVLENSFHGRTAFAAAASAAITKKAAFHQQFEVEAVPLNDIGLLGMVLAKGDVAAVLMEGIQGVGGIQAPTDYYLQQAQAFAKQYGALLILDEVQSGCGRTGKFFAHQWANIEPDLITMAKGIGNGFPVGAVLIAPHLKPSSGLLGSTFGGGPMACAAMLAVLEVLKDEALLHHAHLRGKQLKAQLKAVSGLHNVRGVGLMLGFETNFPAVELRNALLQKGIVVGTAGSHTVRLLPPLNIKVNELNAFVAQLSSTLQKMRHETFLIAS